MSPEIDFVAMADAEIARHERCRNDPLPIDEDGCTAPLSHQLCERLAVTAAERDRLREATKLLIVEVTNVQWRLGRDHEEFDPLLAALERARAVLAPGTAVDVE